MVSLYSRNIREVVCDRRRRGRKMRERMLRGELYEFGQHVMMLVGAKQTMMGGLDKIACDAINELG